MSFWKKIYTSRHTGAEIDAAVDKAGTLPSVSGADEGKVLMVDGEGKIVAGEAGVSGVNLISFTGSIFEDTNHYNISFSNPSCYEYEGVYIDSSFIDTFNTEKDNLDSSIWASGDFAYWLPQFLDVNGHYYTFELNNTSSNCEIIDVDGDSVIKIGNNAVVNLVLTPTV